MSRIALHTFQQVDSSGVTTITIHNMASGGIKGTTETRVVDGDSREHTDYIWGHVKGLCRFMPTGDTTTDDKLSGDWSEETREGECIVDETSAVDGSWSSVMVCMSSVCPNKSLLKWAILCPCNEKGRRRDKMLCSNKAFCVSLWLLIDAYKIKVWGFEIIDNSRHLVRHVTVKRGNESSSAKLVYEYNGATP